LKLHYVSDLEGLAADRVLGVAGYGARRPVGLPQGCPFIATPLHPVAPQIGMFEVWSTGAPVTYVQSGPVMGACGEDTAFGALVLEEDENTPLEDATERAYLHVFDFLDRTGFKEPIRFWNYLTAITENERGVERYRRFNTGRQRAFLARLNQPVPPAASCLGGGDGVSVIYFLAAREAGRAIENPRQISAYEYPPVYGPTSPSFSRASVHEGKFFISGTASIVGHETRHPGDMPKQLAETMENLRVLAEAAGHLGRPGNWAVKAYLRDPAYRETVEHDVRKLFGQNCQILNLRADICRADLLLEIEACHV
jgi:chorismate lyase / 3-hydroxybenzoate synthase